MILVGWGVDSGVKTIGVELTVADGAETGVSNISEVFVSAFEGVLVLVTTAFTILSLSTHEAINMILKTITTKGAICLFI